MSEQIQSLLQQSEIQGFVTLFEVDISMLGMGILRFTSNAQTENSFIQFGGQDYVSIPIYAEDFERSSEGSQARPSLTLSAIAPEISAMLLSGNGLQGARVTRIRTFAQFLDDGSSPDGTAMLAKDIYFIDKVTEWVAGVRVKFELRNALDLENIGLPNLRMSKMYCNNVYRYWNASSQSFVYGNFNPCPYAGSVYYDSNNNQVYNASQDACSKTLDGCELRYGRGRVLPFGGFPGTSPSGR